MEQRNNLVLQGTETSRGAGQCGTGGRMPGAGQRGRAQPALWQLYDPGFAMPAFCNLNVSWNAHAP